MHHLHGAASQTKGHWPQRSLACPIGDLVRGRPAEEGSVIIQRRNERSPRALNDNSNVVTYNAYCKTPFLPSWLGNGTSRLSLPVTLIGGGVPGLSETSPGFVTAVAGFAEVDEIKAGGAARSGAIREDGLAGGYVSAGGARTFWDQHASQSKRSRRPYCGRQHLVVPGCEPKGMDGKERIENRTRLI